MRGVSSGSAMSGRGDDGEVEQEIALLATQLAELLARSSAESQFHLRTGLGAVTYGGVGGDLVIRIPRRSNEHVIVKWVGGGVTGV